MYRCSAHVCPVTQSAQHACVYRVSCARGLRRERVSSTFSQFHGRGYINSDRHICSQFHCTSKVSTVNWIGCPYFYVPSTHHKTLDLASCPSRDVCDDITLLHSPLWKLAEVTKCPSLASSILSNPVSQCPSHCESAIPLRTSCVCEVVMFIFMYVIYVCM